MLDLRTGLQIGADYGLNSCYKCKHKYDESTLMKSSLPSCSLRGNNNAQNLGQRATFYEYQLNSRNFFFGDALFRWFCCRRGCFCLLDSVGLMSWLKKESSFRTISWSNSSPTKKPRSRATVRHGATGLHPWHPVPKSLERTVSSPSSSSQISIDDLRGRRRRRRSSKLKLSSVEEPLVEVAAE